MKEALDTKKVAAVCNDEMIVFGPESKRGDRRQRLESFKFNNHGQALAAAKEFDENEKRLELLRQKRNQ